MTTEPSRLGALDGWRGISILAVLAGHLLPIGPKSLRLNGATATLGMVVFFTLSGFLITRFLLKNDDVRVFLIRRFCRILPLAWLFMIVALVLFLWRPSLLPSHLFFYANLPPITLSSVTGHLWSLCVEMQFYICIAAMVFVGGRRAIFLVPLLCLAVTGFRIWHGIHISIVTYYRVDEILAGCSLAILYETRHGRLLEKVPVWLVLPFLYGSCHPETGWLNYFRPYLSAVAVGATIYQPDSSVTRTLGSRALKYIAEISYALYVIHPLLADTWLGSGDKIVKYLKRPILFAALFALAHLSTFYYEHRWIAWGKARTQRTRTLRPGPVERKH